MRGSIGRFIFHGQNLTMKAILKWKGLKQNQEQHEDPRSKLDTHSPPSCSSASSLSSRKSQSREVSPCQDDKPRVSVQDLGSTSDELREIIPPTVINEANEIDEEMGSNSSSGELETHLGDEHDQALEEDQLVDVEGEIGSQPTDLSQNHQNRDQSDEEIEDSRSQSCDWCRNKLNSNQFTMRSEVDQKVRSFCTERCFSQYRRAAFKKSKVCDWCRKSPLAAESGGMRTISMVEKNNQLNFCDEQCLGQYKMNMFCQEARAQLALLPEALKKIMSGQSNAVATKSAELWLAHQHAQITEQLRNEDKNKNEALALNLNLKSEAATTKQSNSSETSKTQKRSASPSFELNTDRIHPRKKPMVKVKSEHFLKQKSGSIDGRPISSSNGLRDHRQSRRRMHSPVLAPRTKSPTGVATRIRKPATNHTTSLKAQSQQSSPTVGSVPPPPPLMAHPPRPGLDIRSNMFPMGALGSVLPPPPLASGPQLQNGPRPPLPAQMSSLLPPPTLMLPLPCIIPFPIPIPIPIPIPFPSQAGCWGPSSISPNSPTRVAKTARSDQHEVKVKCEVKEEEPDPRPTSAPINRSLPETSEPMDTTTELRRARRRALLMDIPSTNKSVQKH
ncbi:sine oculis-binding protein homolog A-like isoform X1 [Tigriopus californicus]|uniref:sine oculis-binding protein homolog A-like isoform X1 n=1 Tax=Tigriopus californicus TaxID=6832 RepID=UPI0027DA6007|nr:sine oculis-binding protein homolog A-like isoform X1 [Tigriopus californicus]|eukprot:TCALIF_01543-PA protein Name:"Similar to sobpb Sine oculis-binding protein homolog (Danio rerio)" AED:0.20 eAED:0.20 QI:68/0.75/0.6/0.8/0.75/0.8/5/0/615